MCQSKKGPGYDPAEVVRQAIANLGVTAVAFFTAAKEHTKSSFEPKAAAAAYVANKPGYAIPAQVIAFADWVQMKGEPNFVKQKYKALAGPAEKKGVRTLETEFLDGILPA